MYNIIIMISHVYIITLLLFFQSALIKLGCRLSNETHDLLRHLLGSKYEKNPLFPSGPGDKKQKHGKWIKRKMIGTNVSYAHLSSSKSVGQWAKRVGVDAVMNIDDDGGGATISVTKMLNDDLTKKPKEHYQHLLEIAVATVVNVGADAYNMCTQDGPSPTLSTGYFSSVLWHHRTRRPVLLLSTKAKMTMTNCSHTSKNCVSSWKSCCFMIWAPFLIVGFVRMD